MTSPSHESGPNFHRSVESVESAIDSDQLSFQERKKKDPAARVLDAAFYLRRAYFTYNIERQKDLGLGERESVNEANKSLATAFTEDGDMEGGYELMQLRDTLRAEKRGPNKVEKRFLSYVNSVESYYKAHAELEFSGEGGLYADQDETAVQKIDNTIRDNQQTLDDLDGDNSDDAKDARVELKKDIEALKFYKSTLDQEDYLSIKNWHASEYLKNLQSAEASKELGRQAWEYRASARAMNLLATSGYASAKAVSVQKLKRAPELEPVVILDDAPVPARVVSTPTQPAQPKQRHPQRQQVQPDAAPMPAPAPTSKPDAQPVQQRSVDSNNGPANEKLSKSKRDAVLSRTLLKLYGSSENVAGTQVQREGVRNELAREKSKIFQNWMSKREIGRTVLSAFGVDAAKRQEKIYKLEEKFIRLADKKFGLENYDAIKSGLLDDDEKMEQLQIANEVEMNALREKTSEHMRNTLVAKFCKAVGTFEWKNNKHKAAWIFGGAAVAAATIATGGMLPIMMATSTVAVARLDKKIRGLPNATKRMSSVELQDEIRADYASEMFDLRVAEKAMQKAKKKYDKAIAEGVSLKEAKRKYDKATAGNILKGHDEKIVAYPYRIGLRAAMRRFDKDMNWEVGKRLGILGGIGAVAVGGSYLGSAIAGVGYDHLGSWVGQSPFSEAWHDFVGPANFDPSMFSSVDMSNPEIYKHIAQNYRIVGS